MSTDINIQLQNNSHKLYHKDKGISRLDSNVQINPPNPPQIVEVLNKDKIENSINKNEKGN